MRSTSGFGVLGYSKLGHSAVSAQEAKRKSRLGVSTRSDNAACQRGEEDIPLVPFILRSSEIMDSFLFRHGVPNLVTLAGGIVSSRTPNGKFKCCTYSSKRSRTS